MNDENLIPIASRSPRERKEIARKGAEATNRIRAEKKSMRRSLEILLELSTNEGEPVNIEEVGSLKELVGQTLTVRDAMLVGMAIKASKGDTKAVEFIRDTVGEKPTEKVAVANYDSESVKRMDEYLYGEDTQNA